MEPSLDASKIFVKHLIKVLKTNEKLKKTGAGIFQQTAIGAIGMILGGVVGGQRGVAFGGILGIFLGYAISDDYPSLIDVIKRLTDEEKKELWMKCREHFGVATRETLNTVIDTEEKKVAFLKFLKRTVKEVKRT